QARTVKNKNRRSPVTLPARAVTASGAVYFVLATETAAKNEARDRFQPATNLVHVHLSDVQRSCIYEPRRIINGPSSERRARPNSWSAGPLERTLESAPQARFDQFAAKGGREARPSSGSLPSMHKIHRLEKADPIMASKSMPV